jgi:hypothetical protein
VADATAEEIESFYQDIPELIRRAEFVLLNQAGWHVSAKFPVPGDITLLPRPPKSPVLNPVAN